MSGITLGKRPSNFKGKVTVTMLDGTKSEMNCVFIYRTVTEYGSMIDEIVKEVGTQTANAIQDGELPSVQSILERTRDKNGNHILKVIESWDVDAPLNAATAQQLCDEFPGAAEAVFEFYRKASTEGRLGN